ncbi:MAG: septal ring lytic transglycosylase RlpA family protein [Acidobacteriia bacterium]|nr:septal ring lytic transglycosylase RlpA family protein [Terriglobia bacterium]
MLPVLRGDNMRRRLFMIWAALRWLPLMFLVAQGLEAPLVAHTSQPLKPMRTWSGKATWYGAKFQGRKTASGEKYDMYASTGASPNLPFGSLIRVSNPRTHAAQLVRINDRGPFIDDRELDLSYLVACRLGMQDRGVTRVKIELLEVPKRP